MMSGRKEKTSGILLCAALALDAHGILSGFLGKSSPGFMLSVFLFLILYSKLN